MNCINFVVPMNPCHCGYYPDRDRCHCTVGEIHRYLGKVSEPILDRLDICVETGTPEFHLYGEEGETSCQIRQRVQRTVDIQRRRYQKESFSYNGELPERSLRRYCHLNQSEEEFLEDFFQTEECSSRRISRILKVARTIADMEEAEEIREKHIAEAVSLRSIDRKYWGTEL